MVKRHDLERSPCNFCSSKCYHTSRCKKVERTCPVCGKTFVVKPAEIARGWGIFCSKVCSNTGIYNPAYGKEKSPETREKLRQSNTGQTRSKDVCKKISENTIGKKRSESARKNMSEAKKGEKNPFYGKSHSKETLKRMAEIRIGEKSHFWQGGISFFPYCPKFNEPFRERVRDFFDRKCVLCGKTEEQNKKKLSVHHVNHDKETCCNDNRPLFVALCSKCHGKTHHDRNHYQKTFTEIIDKKYNSRCY